MRFVALLFSCCLLLIHTHNALAQQKLTFREPEPGPMVDFLTQVLEEAYHDLGVELEYRPLPRLRAEQLAAKGKIAGELGRLDGLEQQIPSLNRVPFKLYEFSVVLVANTKKCGLCTLPTIESLAHVSGMRAPEQVIEENNFTNPVFKQTQFDQVAKLLNSGRIDGALLGDFQLRNLQLQNTQDFVVYSMRSEAGYHYLHDKFKHLVEPLYGKLNAMRGSGRLAQLRQQHNLTLPEALKPTELPDQLMAVSALHPGLTNADGSGELWDKLNRAFANANIDINISASNWPRAHTLMRNERAQLMVGVRKEQFSEEFLYSETAIGTDDALYLFTTNEASGKGLPITSDDFTVCISEGDYQKELLPNNVTYYRANTPLDCFAMLDLGRVNGVIDYQDNLPDWTDKPYQQQRLSEPVPLYVAFNKTQLGHLLKLHFELTSDSLVNY
ncbi:ABC transporter substrate-binding protein [Idiomarina seosinensis]|uniref:ABC transporter substrate-binding protein n=1 Tax=Idiomarina seosinensis TaxID=281739 RepID=A0A432Z735_9GAMM|nr:ABC transporter substrate-binding protein [Idiomarina seosinensis]RUO73643.1 ABC transporter substrate-binding protein [Idiomarina seosinensis]